MDFICAVTYGTSPLEGNPDFGEYPFRDYTVYINDPRPAIAEQRAEQILEPLLLRLEGPPSTERIAIASCQPGTPLQRLVAEAQKVGFTILMGPV